jgi:hypothetical protein
MKAITKLDHAQVEKMDLTISITATVEEWRVIMQQPPNTYPAWEIAQRISRCLHHIAKSTEAVFTDPLHEAE